MGFFGFLFWMVVIWLALKTWRRWRWERWVAAGPGSYRPYGSGWYDSSEFYAPRRRGIEVKHREKVADQQEYIDALETRVSELEERLDFTERLLAERPQTEAPTPPR